MLTPSWPSIPFGHVGRQVPDGRVVLLDQRQQAGDRRRVRARRGRCGSARSSCGPSPAAPRRRPIGCGSWTMIVSHSPSQALGVHRVDLVEQLPLLVAERLLGALQRVVEELGRVEELLLAEDHVPVGVEADVAHQRHDRVEDLRDAAAEGGRADVEDALALERLRQLADPLDQLLAGDVRVVGEGLLAECDFLKHRRSSTAARSAVDARAAQPPATVSGRLPRVTSTFFRVAVAEDLRASPCRPAASRR